MKLDTMKQIAFILIILVMQAGIAGAGDVGEWGDAPESATAYPSLGVIGAFPTCQNTGPANWIYHGALCWAFFGPGFDFETEGNGGACSSFNPYDNDECFADQDAGLLFPPAYTIFGGAAVPCVGPGSLGINCTWANWGIDIDITLTNGMPVDGFLNVLFDWDQSGSWGGSANCPSGSSTPEHVVVNWPVPVGFSGAASGLGLPPFLIGPNQGFSWVRFSVTEQAVPQDWDGSGIFEDGETEDYLLLIDDGTATSESSWSTVKSLY
jgi:hypothetical protein